MSNDNVLCFKILQGYDSENICNIFSPNKTEDEKVKNGFNVTAYNSLSDSREDTKINIVQRRKPNSSQEDVMSNSIENEVDSVTSRTDWMKIFLLIVAITVHNIPGVYRDHKKAFFMIGRWAKRFSFFA